MASERAAWGRVAEAEYSALDLRAHEFLREAPVHDVWQVFLPQPSSAPQPQLAELLDALDFEALSRSNAAVRFLFALRGWLGRVFHLDGEAADSALADRAATPAVDLERVPLELRQRSLREPGSRDGPFFLLYQLEREALSEIRNATVHAFSVMAIDACEGGARLVWAVHVAPVGRITAFYMALIDPFRRWIVYPALLSHLHRSWLERSAATQPRV